MAIAKGWWLAVSLVIVSMFFFSSRRRHTRFKCDWSSDVCSSDLFEQILTVVSFMKGKYKIDGYVDPQNLLEKIDTRTPNPIFGDMLIETRFSDYKEIGRASCRERV